MGINNFCGNEKDSNSNEFKQLARDGRAADKGTIGSQQNFCGQQKNYQHQNQIIRNKTAI